MQRKKENLPVKTQTPKKSVINNKIVSKANNLKTKVQRPSPIFTTQANGLSQDNYVKTTPNRNNLKAKVNRQPKVNVKKNTFNSQTRINNHKIKDVKNENQLKEKTKKRKLVNPTAMKKNIPKTEDTDNFEIENVDLEKADEFLLNAKKKKLNEAYNIKSEMSLFGKKKLNKKDKLKKMLESNRSSIVVSGDKLRQRMLERLKGE